jgi:hypothetical protein
MGVQWVHAKWLWLTSSLAVMTLTGVHTVITLHVYRSVLFLKWGAE